MTFIPIYAVITHYFHEIGLLQ